MSKEDKLLKIIDGLQDTIRILEADNARLTLNQKESYNPYPWPYIQWAHVVGCMCQQCQPTWTFTTGTDTGTTTDKISIGEASIGGSFTVPYTNDVTRSAVA